MLCELVDNLVAKSDMIRSTMGLPLKDMIEDTNAVDEGSKLYDCQKSCTVYEK